MKTYKITTLGEMYQKEFELEAKNMLDAMIRTIEQLISEGDKDDHPYELHIERTE